MSVSRTPLLATRFAPIDFQPLDDRVFVDPALDPFSARALYRYASLPETIRLLHDNELGFVHPRTWPDHYESRVAERLFGRTSRSPNRVFARCLSTDYASDALWRIYRQDLGVVRISLGFQDLLASLQRAAQRHDLRFWLARVRYLPPDAILKALPSAPSARPRDPAKVAALLSMKRQGFEHENEVRIVVMPGKAVTGDYLPVTLPGGLEPKLLFLDPYLADWQASAMQKALEAFTAADIRQSNFAGKARR